jgi:hypothetical protein
MSVRWVLVAVAAFTVIDCGSDDSSNDECSAGYVKAKVCVECGIAGGCAKTETKCAPQCSPEAECTLPLSCWDGVCQMAGCD